jgi:hypothetical protein
MIRALAIVFALCSAFWVFYTARLLVVTGFLQHTRGGGQGAYIGAAVFPLLALAFGWAARVAWRRATIRRDAAT